MIAAALIIGFGWLAAVISLVVLIVWASDQ